MGLQWVIKQNKRQIHARSFFWEEETNKDFTKATYLSTENVMKLLRIGIKAENGYRTEEGVMISYRIN
jgi:hypothetical protein